MSELTAARDRREAIGLTGERFTMPLELGKLREFALATAAPASPFLSEPEPVITPTFLTIARLWERDNPWPRVGLVAARVLHAEQEFSFPDGPPRVGATLFGESTIEDVYAKDGRRGSMTFAVMATRFTDEHGRLRAEARMTGVETPPAAAQAGDAAPGPEAPAAAPSRVQSSLSASHAPAPAEHGPLTVTDFVRYQGASGDMNPLHHDPVTARQAGFASPISVGMLGAGLLASYAVSRRGAEQLRRFRVRFRAPAFVGDTLTCRPGAEPAAGADDDDLHLACTRQTGVTVAEAWAEFSATA